VQAAKAFRRARFAPCGKMSISQVRKGGTRAHGWVFPPHRCSPQKEPKKPRSPPYGAFSLLVGAKSLEHAIEIQSQFAKKAYDNWMAEASKIGELYAAAARDAYKPVEQAVAKSTPKAPVS